MRITADQIISWDPCSGWDRDTVVSTFKGKEGIDIIDFINLKTITPTDIMWAILRPEILPPSLLLQISFDILKEYKTSNVHPLVDNYIKNGKKFAHMGRVLNEEMCNPFHYSMNLICMVTNNNSSDSLEYFSIVKRHVTKYVSNT